MENLRRMPLNSPFACDLTACFDVGGNSFCSNAQIVLTAFIIGVSIYLNHYDIYHFVFNLDWLYWMC